jgi:type IV pilus assembly protein PilA
MAIEGVRHRPPGRQKYDPYGYETERVGKPPMLKVLHKRLEQAEEGFTLIELMVVVLIIAILMAIAIPTFLGASNSAKDSAVQQDMSNSITESLAYWTSNQTYTAVPAAGAATAASPGLIGALVGDEPNITYMGGVVTAAGVKNDVYVTVKTANVPAGTFDVVELSGISASGKCFYAASEQTTGAVQAVGTFYNSQDTKCVAASVTVPFLPALTHTGSSASFAAGTATPWGSGW